MLPMYHPPTDLTREQSFVETKQYINDSIDLLIGNDANDTKRR